MVENTSAPDWRLPLWDNDGFAHTLVAKSAAQAVTRCGVGFAIWNVSTGALEYPLNVGLSTIGESYRLRNRDLDAEERKEKERAAGIAWDLMHAERPLFCVARNATQGKASHFIAGPFETAQEAAAAAAQGDVVFRVPKGGRPSTEFCESCGCDTHGWMQSHAADCPNIPF